MQCKLTYRLRLTAAAMLLFSGLGSLLPAPAMAMATAYATGTVTNPTAETIHTNPAYWIAMLLSTANQEVGLTGGLNGEVVPVAVVFHLEIKGGTVAEQSQWGGNAVIDSSGCWSKKANGDTGGFTHAMLYAWGTHSVSAFSSIMHSVNPLPRKTYCETRTFVVYW